MRLAVLQGHARVLDPEANLATVDDAASRAAAEGADLLLTPELFVVGYAPAKLRELLDPGSLPELNAALQDIAKRHRIALVYSLPKVESGRWHITSTLIDASGETLGGYTKVHLFGAEEQEVFTPGTEPATVLDFHGLSIGLLICFDVEFPESVRAAALRGAQLLLVPTALGCGYEVISTRLIPTRALESQLFVAYANHCGIEDGFELGGMSTVAAPSGSTLALAGAGPELLFADIDPAELGRARSDVAYLAERRADLYANWDR